MRLNREQIDRIRHAVLNRDPSARVYLFGSRVDDCARGGDIDLLVLSRTLTPDDRRRIKLELYRQVGPRKIDLLLSKDTKKPFVRLALQQGVPL